MLLIWGEQEFVNASAYAFPLLPPNETRVSQWDTWDFRGLVSQPMLVWQGFPPNNLPLLYPVPWQVYPR
ncbi:hypothetical protein MiSe_55070 [Microseira wollei NIES-4236]|uniref:Uncharacterized protein n=1 Tax=Microseira wollei NIES-4236 TaxID=2530354 RepID=A0AAV3XGY4_9CYAN|nr:hypothetical protein MiSe_55070 [Microseira wollei NIES-4236]